MWQRSLRRNGLLMAQIVQRAAMQTATREIRGRPSGACHLCTKVVGHRDTMIVSSSSSSSSSSQTVAAASTALVSSWRTVSQQRLRPTVSTAWLNRQKLPWQTISQPRIRPRRLATARNVTHVQTSEKVDEIYEYSKYPGIQREELPALFDKLALRYSLMKITKLLQILNVQTTEALKRVRDPPKDKEKGTKGKISETLSPPTDLPDLAEAFVPTLHKLIPKKFRNADITHDLLDGILGWSSDHHTTTTATKDDNDTDHGIVTSRTLVAKSTILSKSDLKRTRAAPTLSISDMTRILTEARMAVLLAEGALLGKSSSLSPLILRWAKIEHRGRLTRKTASQTHVEKMERHKQETDRGDVERLAKRLATVLPTREFGDLGTMLKKLGSNEDGLVEKKKAVKTKKGKKKQKKHDEATKDSTMETKEVNSDAVETRKRKRSFLLSNRIESAVSSPYYQFVAKPLADFFFYENVHLGDCTMERSQEAWTETRGTFVTITGNLLDAVCGDPPKPTQHTASSDSAKNKKSLDEHEVHLFDDEVFDEFVFIDEEIDGIVEGDAVDYDTALALGDDASLSRASTIPRADQWGEDDIESILDATSLLSYTQSTNSKHYMDRPRYPQHPVSFEAMPLLERKKSAVQSKKQEYHVFIDNLPIDISEDEIVDLYSVCGKVVDAKVFNQRPDLDPGPLSRTQIGERVKQNLRENVTATSRWRRPCSPVYGMLTFADQESYEKALDDALRIFGMIIHRHSVRSIPTSGMTSLYLENVPYGHPSPDVEDIIGRILDPDLFVCLTAGQNDRAMVKSCDIKFPSFEWALKAYPKLMTLDIVGADSECTLNWKVTRPNAKKWWRREIIVH